MRADERGATAADVCLLLEGTYPYVSGGVSSWVHDLLAAFPERRFLLMHIGATPDAYPDGPRYQLPPNVVRLCEVYCRHKGPISPPRAKLLDMVRSRRAQSRPSRVLRALERLHLTSEVNDDMVADLASADLSLEDLLYGEEAYSLAQHLYRQLASGSSFLDFFWHFRAMHAPLVRMFAVRCPEARVYHAASAGYAGLVGALESHRNRRPFVLTEHGIYAREREMELSRASWIRDQSSSELGVISSPLRRLWTHHFKMLSRIAYHQAERVITLSAANRNKQLADGADPEKTVVVPNGVDLAFWSKDDGEALRPDRVNGLRVGFVGRVVPIKDVLTFIRACARARERVPLEAWIVGPCVEEPDYVRRCKELVRVLGIDECVRFLGPQPASEIYPQLDVVVLTSLSEGQPLVILEAHAAGLPVIATDVGACRELLEGGDGDRDIGPSGIVTRIASPEETAAALVELARDPEIRRALGRAGRERVRQSYRLEAVIGQYDSLYGAITGQEIRA